jgi:hypothetical protein
VSIEAPEEVPNRPRSYVVSGCIAFGLYVDTVKSECVLVDHAVDAIIA